MNISSTAETYAVPSMMSSYVVGMENTATSQRQQQQQQQLWDWDTTQSHHQQQPSTNLLTGTPTGTHAFLGVNGGGNAFMDCQSSFLPVTNFPFYPPMVTADYPHDHHPQAVVAAAAMIKQEDTDRLAVGQIGLNLGHRTYFSSGDAVAIDRLFRRSRGLYQVSHQVPRCQVEGCKVDLSGAKHYHRRHKVCEFHSKATVVVAGGLQQRFCQQCSRFHVLTEFDEAKRSCRKRLADHNRRRRKPQQPTTTAADDSSSEKSKQTTTQNKAKDIIPAASNGTTTNNSSSNNNNSSSGACSIANTSSSSGIVSTFSSMSIMETLKEQRRQEAGHLRRGPALSLGGADNGRIGFHHGTAITTTADPYDHRMGRPFLVMSEEESSHPHHHHHHSNSHNFPSSSSSSSASTFFHPHHNFFSDSSGGGGGGGGSPVVQSSGQGTGLLHLGQGLFEVDFM